MSENKLKDPQIQQESMYSLPYHWFPETYLRRFERQVKHDIIMRFITENKRTAIRNYLDVGCGDGRWTTDIHAMVSEKVEHQDVNAKGIDFSKRAIGFAKLISTHIDFSVHKGEALPFSDETFDLVTSIEVIEHVEDGQEEDFLSELHRVTRKDGLVILSTPSWNLKIPPHHFRHYTQARLEELAAATNFEFLDIRGQSVPCYGWKRSVRRIMERLPKVWRLWKYSFAETRVEKSLNLIFVLRPK